MVPVDTIRAAVRSKDYNYVTLRAAVREVLKGKPKSTDVAFQCYVGPDRYPISPRAVIDLDRKKALVFLVRTDEPGTGGWYLAEDTPNALRVMDPAIAKRIQDEVENQQAITAAWPGSAEAQPDAQQTKVQALIEQMLDKRTEQAAFKKLERMGQAAVPSMIRLMDDRRPLPLRYIALENKSPRAFEAFRQYSPAVVVDATAALLNQITGEDFGSIFNGGSERERARTVDGWRIYLHYRFGKSRAVRS